MYNDSGTHVHAINRIVLDCFEIINNNNEKTFHA